MKFNYVVIFLLALTIAGCGYTTHSLLPPHVTKIYVDNFKNSIDITSEVSDKEPYKIYRPGVETELTKAVIDRFVFDGNLRLAAIKDADSKIEGELLEYIKEPLRYDTGSNVTEYRIKLVASAKFIDLIEHKTLWQESRFIGEVTYRTTGAFAKTEDTARAEALTDLARRLVERTIEAW